jgi:hypothetical protein
VGSLVLGKGHWVGRRGPRPQKIILRYGVVANVVIRGRLEIEIEIHTLSCVSVQCIPSKEVGQPSGLI